MKPINLRDPLYIVIIIALILLFMWQCESAKNSKLSAGAASSMLAARDAEFNEYKRLATATIDSINQRRTKSDSLAKSRQKALESSVSTWQKRAAVLRPAVVVMSDSVPVLKEYIYLQDSVIAFKDSLILAVEMSKLTQRRSFEAEIVQLKDINLHTEAQVSMWRDSQERGAKELKREQRKKRLWRGLTVIAATAAGVIYLTSQ